MVGMCFSEWAGFLGESDILREENRYV